jgi:hypothetical protein
MGKAALVERDIEEGARLVDKLVASGEKVPVALWLYDSSREDWRLVLAVPQMARGSREAYKFLDNVIKDIQPPLHITLQDLTLVSPRADLVTSLLKEKRSARELSGRILPSMRIGDAYLEGAYLYKVA